MKVKSSQGGELEKLRLDVLKMAIGKINPNQGIWVRHHIIKSLSETCDTPNWVVLKEKSLGLMANYDLLCCLSFLLLCLAAIHWVLFVVQERDVVLPDQFRDYLTLRSLDDDFFLFFLHVFILFLWLVSSLSAIILFTSNTDSHMRHTSLF